MKQKEKLHARYVAGKKLLKGSVNAMRSGEVHKGKATMSGTIVSAHLSRDVRPVKEQDWLNLTRKIICAYPKGSLSSGF